MNEISPANESFLPHPKSSPEPLHSVLDGRIPIKYRPSIRELLIQILALVTTSVLLWAQLTGQYWKDYRMLDQDIKNELRAIQFAAKLHELLMLASLSYLVFFYTRRFLLGKKGLPLGLFSAAHTVETGDTFLSAPFYMGFSKSPMYGILIALTAVLSIALGPSSAIAMVPALGWYDPRGAKWSKIEKDWSSKAGIVYAATPEELWPTTFNSNITGNQTHDEACLGDPFNLQSGVGMWCPAGGFNLISNWVVSMLLANQLDYMTFKDNYSGAKRQIMSGTYMQWGAGNGSGLVNRTGAIVTAVDQLTATMLGTFYNYITRNNIAKINEVLYPSFIHGKMQPTYQPLVQVNCALDPDADRPNANITFPPTFSWWSDDPAYVNDPPVLQSDHAIWKGLPDTSSRFIWLKDSRENSSSSTLALAIVPLFIEGSNKQHSAAVACSIDARWAATEAYFTPMNSTNVQSNFTDAFWGISGNYHPNNRVDFALSEKPLDLQPDWALYLNPKVNETNAETQILKERHAMDVMLDLGTALHSGTNITTFNPPRYAAYHHYTNIERFIAIALGTIIADGIARRSTDNPRQMPYFYTAENSTSPATVVSLSSMLGFKYKDMVEPTVNHLDHGNMYFMWFHRYGYAYGWSITGAVSKSLVLSMVVLSLHAALVVMYDMHVCYDWIRHKYIRIGNWSDVGSLQALALNSATGGIVNESDNGASGSLWRERLKIYQRDSRNLHLRLVSGRTSAGGLGFRDMDEKRY